VLQCVAVCYSVLQRAAVCCSLLQSVAVCCSVLQCHGDCASEMQSAFSKQCSIFTLYGKCSSTLTDQMYSDGIHHGPHMASKSEIAVTYIEILIYY